jgi:peroxiredoxin
LKSLRDNFQEFQRRGIKVLAISASTPYFNREAFKRGGEFPFPLLSDPTLQTHHTWNAYDA